MMPADAGYSSLVVDHFERPRNSGRFESANDVVDATAGSADQGVVFHLSARVSHHVIKSVRFEAYGCPHCIAAGSWLSERLTGMSPEELTGWTWHEVAQMLEVPSEKRGRLLILEDTVRHLAEAWRRRVQHIASAHV